MENTFTRKVGGILADLRQQKGVTQDEVAEAIGISNKTLSKWETGINTPDMEMLLKLSEYFEISTDTLFGKTAANVNFATAVSKEYAGLSGEESILKSFSLVNDVIVGNILANFEAESPAESAIPKHIISANEFSRRSQLAENAYHIIVNSEDVNMAVMLYNNAGNFKWLESRGEEIRKVFDFLSDKNGLRLVKLIHTKNFPIQFTADFVAKTLSIPTEEAAHVAELAEKATVCSAIKAHLKDGVTTIYSSLGCGMVLSAITLAYEQICGYENHVYNKFANTGLKLIEED